MYLLRVSFLILNTALLWFHGICFFSCNIFYSFTAMPSMHSVLTIVDGKMIFNRLKNNDNFD